MKKLPSLFIITLLATPLQAQAPFETPEDVAAIMQSCAIVARNHDYDAAGQEVAVAWNRITDRSASFGAQDGIVNVSANVWGNGSSGNSFCDFLFEDETLARAAFDQFMADKDPITFEDSSGICVDDAFIMVAVTGPEGPLASTMRKQGHITVHNAPKYSGDPCAQ